VTPASSKKRLQKSFALWGKTGAILRGKKELKEPLQIPETRKRGGGPSLAGRGYPRRKKRGSTVGGGSISEGDDQEVLLEEGGGNCWARTGILKADHGKKTLKEGAGAVQ